MYDVIIIGSGPAGLTAAIYTTRANLKTLIIAGARWGGQLMLTSTVENFPGFPEGILGPELMARMRKQAEHHGAEIVEADFVQGNFAKPPFKVQTAQNSYEGKSVIVATGADTKWLGVTGEKEKIGHGISSCAPCDAPFFRNKNVIVVGGGDSAMEEALFLTKFAINVVVMHRSDTLRASSIMQERAKANPKIHFMYNSVIEEIMGEGHVEKVKVRTKPSDKSLLTKSKKELDAISPALFSPKTLSVEKDSIVSEFLIDGIFVAIGHMPNSRVFTGIDLDEKGFVKVQNHYHTNVEGVFVAGDVHDAEYKQAVSAAGYGCAAALEVGKWLSDQAA